MSDLRAGDARSEGRCRKRQALGDQGREVNRRSAAAYEQRSIAITTNVDFEHWTQFLPDAATATAILDRFLHHCHVIALDGESFRLREARQVVTPA